jgi:hypothetical protein
VERISRASLVLLVIALCGCAASASFTQTGDRYPAFKGPVKVFFEVPDLDYQRIGIVSSQGGSSHSKADMLKAMQKEAAEYGANAIIVISEKTKENLAFSAGEFGAFGGTFTEKNASAVAVRVPQEEDVDGQNNQLYGAQENSRITGGVAFNFLPLVLPGYGAEAWAGKDRFRIVGEFYGLDIPSGLLTGGPKDGRIEQAYRINGQYLFLGDMSGPYVSGGFEYTSTDVGYEGTDNRTTYGSSYLSGGFGYLLRFNEHVYLDSKISLNARLNDEEICVSGGGCFQPDSATPIGFLGVGVNF